jgi:hypothetical protein
MAQLAAHFLKAYRWQYILSGAAHPRFRSILASLVTETQGERIESAVDVLQALAGNVSKPVEEELP